MAQDSKPDIRRPSRNFAEKAIALAKEKFGTNAEILKRMGYEGSAKNNTLRLLKDGEGSARAGDALMAALKKAGVDTKSLPPMFDGDPAENDWQAEWAQIGRLLHEYAPPIYERYVDDLRPLARALAKQIEQEREIFRPT